VSRSLADLSWPEAERDAAGSLLVVPLGATEQHGPHLPLSTDSDIALALAEGLAARRPEVVLAPLLAYGSSGEHAGFPGTISIGAEATELVLVELCRSASATYRRILLLSTHGGNAEPVRRAVARLRDEARDVRAWSPRWEGDAHAGETETSMMLALDSSRVSSEHAERGNVDPIEELIAELVEVGIREVSANGVLGDPSCASAARGWELIAAAVADLEATVSSWPAATPAPGATR
jgi:mycofactocin system creatininase family protein